MGHDLLFRKDNLFGVSQTNQLHSIQFHKPIVGQTHQHSCVNLGQVFDYNHHDVGWYVFSLTAYPIQQKVGVEVVVGCC